MRPEHEFRTVLALVSQGLNDCEISRRTGVPRCTVRDWRLGRRKGARRHECDHDPSALPHPSYAYLLGLYLGDGYIAAHPRGVFALRIALDLRYPGIISSCEAAVAAVAPGQSVGLVRLEGHVEVKAYWRHWPCLFPQHGPGTKHSRPIVLVDWQERIVDAEPQQFIRGLIHSDGCRFMNRVRVGGKQYAYPRYNFSNNSADIAPSSPAAATSSASNGVR